MSIIAKREEDDSTSLVRLDSGNIIWEQCRGEKEKCWGSCRKVLNRHQRLNMPFSQRMNILRLQYLFCNPWNLHMLPSAQTSYQSAVVFLSRWRMSRTLICRDWLLFACQTYRVELIDVCTIWVRCWQNIPKAKVCFSISSEGWERRNQCIDSVQSRPLGVWLA